MVGFAGYIEKKLPIVGLIAMFFLVALSSVAAPPLASAAETPHGAQPLAASVITHQSDTLQIATTRASNNRESLVNLYVGGDYSSYDITGDGKADTIKVRSLGTMSLGSYATAYEGLTVYVNGKKALTLSKNAFNTANDGYVLQLATLKNGKVFLYVRSKWYNQLDTTNRLYRYKGGKLALVKDLIRITDSRDGLKNNGSVARSYGLRGPNGITVKGNRIVARGMLANSLVGSGSFDINLLYKKGKLVLSPRTSALDIGSYTYPSTTMLIAKRSITAYKSSTGAKKAFSIKKGQKVAVKKISIRNKNPRVQVKVGKKTGWLKLVRNVNTLWSYDPSGSGHKYFENVTAVG